MNKLLVNNIKPVERPTQIPGRQFPVGPLLVEVDDLIRAKDAREAFNVSGAGLSVAVLDTGLRTTHIDFLGRVLAQRNFTTDNGSRTDDATDGQGHGTNVTGIIASNGHHIGIAPDANVIPLKVLANDGAGSFEAVVEALDWIIANRSIYNISCVCMSLGDASNRTSDAEFEDDHVKQRMDTLKGEHVACLIAAGNDFYGHDSRQGMSYPAILRNCISVGAVYDSREGPMSYRDGATAHSTDADRITPFSQRLHPSISFETFTDIFAPGAPVTSSGILDDNGESTQHGTSQATPVAAGVVLLMQQFYKVSTGVLPTVDKVIELIRQSGVPIIDGDDESDNVQNTNLEFIRLDAMAALRSVRRNLERQVLASGGLVRG